MTTFLITGASSGIGFELALQALRRGHRVIGATRNAEKAGAATPEFVQLGGELNVSEPAAEAAVRAIAEEETIDMLVNCAGYALLSPQEMLSDSEAIAEMETNFPNTLVLPAAGMGPYEDMPAGSLLKASQALKATKTGDVRKAAEVLLDVVLGIGLGERDEVRRALRVPLGQDRWPLAKSEAEAWLRELEPVEAVSMSVVKEA